MPRIERSILINAPVNEVFAYIADPTNSPSWIPGMVSVRDVAGVDVGKTFSWTYKMAGISFGGGSTIMECISNEKIVVVSQGGILSVWTYNFRAEGEGTRVDANVVYTIPIPVVGKVIQELILVKNEREANFALAKLKEILEASASMFSSPSRDTLIHVANACDSLGGYVTTHQERSGESDDEYVSRIVGGSEARFDLSIWKQFDTHVAPRLAAHPTVVDLGCGPGLLLRELGQRLPDAPLFGYDVTLAMIEHAQALDYGDLAPVLEVCDFGADRIPQGDLAVDLVVMTRTLHILDDPFAVLGEVRRILKPKGTFMLFDWVRIPLQSYLTRRPSDLQDTQARSRATRMFPFHARYTVEDWRWLLDQAGFDVVAESGPLHERYWFFVARP